MGRTQLGIAVADAAPKPLRSIEGATVTVTSLYNGKQVSGTTDIGTQTLTAGSSNLATASFDEAFLDPAYPKKVLPAGCTLHISMEYDGTIYDQVAGLEIKEAPFDDDASGSVAIMPGAILGSEDLNLFAIPDSLPKPLGGSQFSIWKPKFPVMFDFSPLGYVMFGLRLGSLSHVDDKGLLGKDGCKKTPRESAGKQFDRLCSEQSKAIENVRSIGSSPDGSGKSSSFAHKCTKEIKIGVAAQVFAELAYDWDASEWTGGLSAMVGAGVDASWTVQMVIVSVPVYITFELGAAVNAGLKFGMRTYGPSVNKLLENATYDTESSNVSITFEVSVGLSLGVGTADVLCAYVRGAGYISTCVAFYQADPSLPTPRLTAGLELSASVGVQFLLLKWSDPLWSQDRPCIYDSNNPGGTDAIAMLADNGSLPLDANGMPSFDTFARDMRIVTNEELLGVREFEASPAAVAALSMDGQGAVVADETGTTTGNPTLLEPEDLGDDVLAWQMPALAELDDNAAVMLVSGTRPQGDETTFATANSQTVISVLRLHDSNAEGDNPPPAREQRHLLEPQELLEVHLVLHALPAGVRGPQLLRSRDEQLRHRHVPRFHGEHGRGPREARHHPRPHEPVLRAPQGRGARRPHQVREDSGEGRHGARAEPHRL